jgi:hypothetical protein
MICQGIQGKIKKIKKGNASEKKMKFKETQEIKQQGGKTIR